VYGKSKKILIFNDIGIEWRSLGHLLKRLDLKKEKKKIVDKMTR
jgi:hypothetical protein